MRSEFTFWPGFARLRQRKQPRHELRELREDNNINAGKPRRRKKLRENNTGTFLFAVFASGPFFAVSGDSLCFA
jgi:hypothetical protein